MRCVAPAGPVYQAGTLSGNPLAVAAGLAALRRLEMEKPYAKLEALGMRLERGLREVLSRAGVSGRVNRVGSMFTLFFTDRDVVDFTTAKTCDTVRFNAWFHAMLEAGIYLPPSQFEAALISAAHTEADIDRMIERHGCPARYMKQSAPLVPEISNHRVPADIGRSLTQPGGDREQLHLLV
jgi:glutamate-1-semialdehyde 2,1-aminomutase